MLLKRNERAPFQSINYCRGQKSKQKNATGRICTRALDPVDVDCEFRWKSLGRNRLFFSTLLDSFGRIVGPSF